jgi:hypothetical protein
MSLFYYSFFQNKTNYLHNQHYLLQEICLQEISSILIILRLNIKFSIVIQSLWLFFVFNFFILKIKDMILTNNTSRLFKYYQMSNIIIMSILFGRMISLFVIKYHQDKKVFKILDFIIIILFLLVFSYFIYGKRYNFNLNTIDSYLKKKNKLFFYGIAPIYEPISAKTSDNINPVMQAFFCEIQIIFESFFISSTSFQKYYIMKIIELYIYFIIVICLY